MCTHRKNRKSSLIEVVIGITTTEKDEGKDLEMEDAQTEEERDTIRADRALAKQHASSFTAVKRRNGQHDTQKSSVSSMRQ